MLSGGTLLINNLQTLPACLLSSSAHHVCLAQDELNIWLTNGRSENYFQGYTIYKTPYQTQSSQKGRVARRDNQRNTWLSHRRLCYFKNGLSVARRRVTNEGPDRLSLRPVTTAQTLYWHHDRWSVSLQEFLTGRIKNESRRKIFSCMKLRRSN